MRWQSLVECTGLENRRALAGPGGSNPSPTALATTAPWHLLRGFLCGLDRQSAPAVDSQFCTQAPPLSRSVPYVDGQSVSLHG